MEIYLKIEKEYTEAARRLDRNGTDEARAAAARLSERKNELMEYMSEGISMLLMENYIHYFYFQAISHY